MKRRINNSFINAFFKDFFRKKINVFIIVFSLIICFCIFLYFICIPDLSVFPGNKKFNFKTYTDSTIGGNSKVTNFKVTDSLINFDFILKDSAYVHYVGISTYYKEWKKIDISDYNQFEIELLSNNVQDIGVYLFTPNIYNKKIEDICFFNKIKYVKGKKKYSIDIHDFKVPSWWYDFTNISPNKKIPIDLKQFHYFNIGNAYTAEVNQKCSFRISSIIFTRDNTTINTILIIIEFVIVLLLLIFQLIRDIIKHKKIILVEYRAIETDGDKKQLYSFLDYINVHFNNCELTLEEVSHQTGINHRRITNYIQQNFDCNFKTYLNNIRIEESKRILISTELNIGEISYKVGFNSQSYFNHVFKINEGISPTAYRENFKHKI
jgi:AraC-like DNA-binding protein